jgi:radical SAM superfamily enzyme YgiQ (UPF0313 family)
MHFHGPIVRPPSDADSVFIEVTVGCTYDGCTFCNFYKDFPFRVAPLSQIEADLKEASKRWPHAKKIWANGGNPYALSVRKLEEIAKLFKKYMPQAQISTYARVDDFKHKSVEDIRHLGELGFNNLLIGIESGDDQVLKEVNKGYTVADILDMSQKLDEAGVNYRIIYLGGLAGKGRAEETAKRSVEVLNQMHPYLMYLTTLSVLPGTPLFNEMRNGKFIAHMPEQKKAVLNLLDEALSEITDADEVRIAAYRHNMVTVE